MYMEEYAHNFSAFFRFCLPFPFCLARRETAEAEKGKGQKEDEGAEGGRETKRGTKNEKTFERGDKIS